ncbi:MAG: hypothetical protein A3F25_02425 [Candidatus Yanofskybacteria bacterium RIFCSPHIGHO2_12_FULL_45_19b]|uniref:Hydroxyacid dehydrogenase n=1 Tax=Candidatus Yanofskybacteria bacterium RIFCSPHIGHO2_12_FULL_45_19b TaxID=1802689 RepID=A0A1F8G3C1_9BACT|nr:MAG: hypothetical protein A3F25_02425 [Candidatus Yanofskybacteria bacterium RIFCSPHIGHO2_12_FULL_45_19b]
MKIAIFEATAEDRELLPTFLPDLELAWFEEKLKPETVALAEGCEVISVFVNSQIDRAVIEALPELKLIATRSTGFDHIDTKVAGERGINITNVPGYGSRSVAEFTFALMLTLSRRIFTAHSQIRSVGTFTFDGLEGFDLFGKTLGIVGTGNIGRNVARIAVGFGMKVIGYDGKPDEKLASELGFSYAPLPELLANSDIVTLHLPYNPETHHIINRGNIYQMRPGSYLINTARGELIETDALVGALQKKHLAGAGMDVLEGEHELKEEMELITKDQSMKNVKTILEDHVLMELPQVVITPHIAFFSKEAKLQIIKTTAENILAWQAGRSSNLVGK